MLQTSHATHGFTYAKALAASEKINWRVEDIIGGTHRLDFSKPFMPESLARTSALDFLDAEARRQRTRRHVAAHDLERDDFNLANQLFAHVHGLDVMRRDPDRVQVLHDEPGDLVVDDAFAFKDRFLLRVERGGVILEVLDDGAGLGSFEKNLGFAFVNTTAAVHAKVHVFSRG